MALVIKDRVKETTTSTGTGAITLGGASPNFRTFSSVLSDADTTYYAIVDDGNLAFEVGLGTYASSGNTITRTAVLSSSNSNSAVNFSAGTKTVILTYPADKSVFEDADGVVSIENIKIDTNSITATNTDGNVQLTANGTGVVEVRGNTNPGSIYLRCENNSHGITIKSAAHSATANYTLELPDAVASSNGQALVSTTGGKLSFATAGINTGKAIAMAIVFG